MSITVKIAFYSVSALIAMLIVWRITERVISSGRKPPAIVYTVGTDKLVKQEVTETLSYEGIVEGDPEIKVYPQATGVFVENLVHEGDYVKKDQFIAYIDRNIPGEDYSLLKVESPIDGYVTKLYFLDRGMNVTLNDPVAVVANINKIKVVINVGESDLLKIKKGMPVLIYSLSDKSRSITTTVDSVTPVVDEDTFSGSVTIKAPNKEGVLLSGMSVGVDINVGQLDAYMVPQEAILTGENKSYVFIVSNEITTNTITANGGKSFLGLFGKIVKVPVTNNVAREVDVKLGYMTGDSVEISGDFQDGAQIITEGGFKLYDGASVRVIPKFAQERSF